MCLGQPYMFTHSSPLLLWLSAHVEKCDATTAIKALVVLHCCYKEDCTHTLQHVYYTFFVKARRDLNQLLDFLKGMPDYYDTGGQDVCQTVKNGV